MIRYSTFMTLKIRRMLCYLVMIFLAVLSLFPFYILIINSTRTHSQIQMGFSFFPGLNFVRGSR